MGTYICKDGQLVRSKDHPDEIVKDRDRYKAALEEISKYVPASGTNVTLVSNFLTTIARKALKEL